MITPTVLGGEGERRWQPYFFIFHFLGVIFIRKIIEGKLLLDLQYRCSSISLVFVLYEPFDFLIFFSNSINGRPATLRHLASAGYISYLDIRECLKLSLSRERRATSRLMS